MKILESKQIFISLDRKYKTIYEMSQMTKFVWFQ